MNMQVWGRVPVISLMLLAGACDEGDFASESADDAEFRSSLPLGGRAIAPSSNAWNNAGGGGDWINNGLSHWDISGLDPAYSLSSWLGLNDDQYDDDLDDDEYSEGWLADGDPEEFAVIEYVVECALEEGQSIVKDVDGVPVVLEGHLGLAPQWEDGECDNDCQQWVSACLIARRNATGEAVDIWVDGANPALGVGSSTDFPFFEGMFFGNLFTPESDDDFACQGSSNGLFAAMLQHRMCAQGSKWCDLTVLGNCWNQAGCNRQTLECQPDPNGPVYHALRVRVGEHQL